MRSGSDAKFPSIKKQVLFINQAIKVYKIHACMCAYSKGSKSIDSKFTSEINLLEISSILLILNGYSKMLWDFICQ